MIIRTAIYLIAFLTLSAVSGNAQSNSDWHTWGAVVATGALGDNDSKLRYWVEGQGRFNDDSSRFNQGIVRGALGYKLAPRTTLWGGYAFIPSDPQNRRDDIVEHRAWQQLTWSSATPVLGFKLASRTRLEQRTIESADDTGWRFRELVKLTRPVADSEQFYWSLWDELFVNFNDTDWGANGGIDQNRAFGGIGYKLASYAKVEVGYMHQFVRRQARADAHNHILSFTLLLNY